jgi:hypothetical protein
MGKVDGSNPLRYSHVAFNSHELNLPETRSNSIFVFEVSADLREQTLRKWRFRFKTNR